MDLPRGDATPILSRPCASQGPNIEPISNQCDDYLLSVREEALGPLKSILGGTKIVVEQQMLSKAILKSINTTDVTFFSSMALKM